MNATSPGFQTAIRPSRATCTSSSETTECQRPSNLRAGFRIIPRSTRSIGKMTTELKSHVPHVMPPVIPHDSLILVGDGQKALFLRNRGSAQHVDLVVERILERDNPPTREQGTDRPGR